MMICLAIPSEAQTKNSTQHDYYIYSWIQVRGANKANGDHVLSYLYLLGMELIPNHLS